MLDMQNPEDRKIRLMLIGAASFVLVGFLATTVAVAVMISLNWNFMNWLE